MAHFAEIDSQNTVLRVVVVANAELMDGEMESEQKGIAFCKSLFGQETNWVQTSYNASFRKNYAATGDTYDPARDAFIAPQPYPSWVLDEATALWKAPVAMPQDGKIYAWDETLGEWRYQYG